MRARTFVPLFGAVATIALGCRSTTQPNVYLETPGDGAGKHLVGSGLGEVRLSSDVCKDEPIAPESRSLNEDDLVQFLTAHGMRATKTRARSDLVYVEVVQGNETVRLRVAILPSAPAAGHELHEAILEHGPGSWGIHRSNLAVLAPIGSFSSIIAFAVKTKLACWGVLTVAGNDDTFVVAGGYMEL